MLGAGTKRFIRSAAVASKHAAGMMLPGKIAEYGVPAAIAAPPRAEIEAAHPGRLYSTVATVESCRTPAKGWPKLKLPSLSWLVGTEMLSEVMPWRRRCPSYEEKKNVLSRRMGPPKVPPNSFCLKSA